MIVLRPGINAAGAGSSRSQTMVDGGGRAFEKLSVSGKSTLAPTAVARLRGDPFVAMMKAANLRNGDDSAIRPIPPAGSCVVFRSTGDAFCSHRDLSPRDSLAADPQEEAAAGGSGRVSENGYLVETTSGYRFRVVVPRLAFIASRWPPQ